MKASSMTKRGAPSKKQRFRSFTTDDETLDSLKEVADSRKLSVNALLQGIIEDYLTMERQKEHLGVMGLTKLRTKMFLKHIDASKEFWEETARASLNYWEYWSECMEGKRDLATYVEILDKMSLHGCKIDRVDSEGGYRIFFFVDLGELMLKITEIDLRVGYKCITGKELPDDAIKILDNGLVLNIPNHDK